MGAERFRRHESHHSPVAALLPVRAEKQDGGRPNDPEALQEHLIGFVVGKITATFAAPLFPKFVLLLSADTIIGVIVVIAICALASIVAIRMALKVDPAEAIGG